MVGNFSRYFVGRPASRRPASRRSLSAIDGRVPLVNTEIGRATSVGGVARKNGIEVGGEFRPVVHPIEPLDKDSPMQCPLLEPSLINDGIIWRNRVSGGLSSREDLTTTQEGSPIEAEAPKSRLRSRPPPVPRMISPTIAAPEQGIKISPSVAAPEQGIKILPPIAAPEQVVKISPSIAAPEQVVKLLEESGI